VYSKEICETKCKAAADFAKSNGYPFLVQAEPE
jgi:ATP-dependent Clp protease adapter protein ClpS